jgi:hypothetical protein
MKIVKIISNRFVQPARKRYGHSKGIFDDDDDEDDDSSD